ncbi:MAG: substrate-binding domain-containing protein [Magnetospirillum sp. WYHS-4]
MSVSAARVGRWLSGLAILLLVPQAAAQPPGEAIEEFALRKNLAIAAPAVMRPYAEAAAQYFVARRQFPVPAIDYQTATNAFARFCKGIGVEYPDVVVAPRRISRNEFRVCGEQGVSEIVEVAVGHEVLVLAARQGALPFNATAETLYRALALEVPRDGVFYTNAARRWTDVDAKLPDTEIQVALPPGGSGLRHLFDDRAMEGGCRYVPEIRAIYGAGDRVRKCIAAREDGRISESGTAEAMTNFLNSMPPGALAVVPRRVHDSLMPTSPLLPFEGVLPTQQSVESGEYLLSRKIYFYFKVGHMHGRKGYGVTRGLREFLLDTASEQAVDPGGFFERLGLMLLPPSDRARQRLEALMQRPMSR